MNKIVVASVICFIFLALYALLEAAPLIVDTPIDVSSDFKRCETTVNGVKTCSHFKCGDVNTGFEEYATSFQGKEVIGILSEIKNSVDFAETIHQNETLLKAIGLFLQSTGVTNLREEQTEGLFDYLREKTKWGDGMSVRVAVKKVKGDVYLVGVGYAATTQPGSLYIFYDSAYKKIATGEGGLSYVSDFRLRGDELGVIFCRTPGSTHPEADFALLRNENDKWRVVWNSMRESEWIATDGDVKYLADDLSLLLVTGSADFGINDVEESARNKIIENVKRKGTDRQLASIWEKKGGTYVRKSKLPHDAPLYERLLEMTE